MGWRARWSFVLLKLSHRTGNVPLANGRQVHLRARSSDFAVFEEVFVRRDYQHPPLADARRILDLGACTGLATFFLADLYPGAKIVAIEPAPANYQALLDNVGELPNVICRQLAIWDRPGRVRIRDPHAASWAATVGEDGAGPEVQAATLPELLDELGWETVDLVKMDIEGAERRVLQAGGWLRRTRALLIELHERLEPGCSAALEAAIKEAWGGWEIRQAGFVNFLLAPAANNQDTHQTPSGTFVNTSGTRRF